MSELDETLAVNSIFMVFCTTLLPTILLGVALFYSGITQRRSSFTMMAVPLILTPFIFIDWFIWGYSLCYLAASNRFIGNLNFAVMRHLRDQQSETFYNTRGNILTVNHFLFNGFMKIVCAAFTFPGCIAERGRIWPMLVFTFFWSVLIYNPVTYWFWNSNGWLLTELNYLPVLDFAGGNCIHVVSGFTALAYSYLLGPRNPKVLYNYRSSNFGYILIGTFFIVAGWCAFIAGCDFKFSATSIYIVVSTLLCASTCGVVWLFIDYYFSAIPLDGSKDNDEIADIGLARKLSMGSFSSGMVTGLVVQTPAGGYVSSPEEFWKAFVFGVVGAITGNFATRLKYYFRIDDVFDLFAIHGVAGIVGSLLVGIFANTRYHSEGGWVEGNWVQLGYQLAGSVVTGAYVFVMSMVLLYIIDLVPGLHLRIDKNFNQRMREQVDDEQLVPQEAYGYEKAELLGTDWYEFTGEFTQDFMEFIKVIRPEDYDTDDIVLTLAYGSGSVYNSSPPLRKRESN